MEGLRVLEMLGSDDLCKGAFCLHPIVQSQADYNASLRWDKNDEYGKCDYRHWVLATEYRNIANSYLSNNYLSKSDKVSLGIKLNNDGRIKDMLIADKVQNYKDFLLYHHGTHERSDDLDRYFNVWFDILGIVYEDIVGCIK